MPSAQPTLESLRSPSALLRLGVAILALMGLVFVAGYFFREPLTAFGHAVVDRGGLVGLAALIFLLDPVPGLGFQTGLLVGTTAGVPPWGLLGITFVSSLLSALCGWCVGRFGPRWPWLLTSLEITGAAGALRRWGAAAVVVAAIGPLPYGLASLAAGTQEMPLSRFMLAASTRVFKIGVSLAAMTVGWELSA